MKANWVPAENEQGNLTITLEGKEWQTVFTNGVNRLLESGKLKQKAATPDDVLNEGVAFADLWQAMSEDLATYLNKALQMYQLDPIGHGDIDLDEIEADHIRFTYGLQLAKPIALGPYIGLPYHLEEASVKEEEIEQAIAQILGRFAYLEEKNGSSELGDSVNIDFVGKIDGVSFEGGSDSNYDLKLGSGQFIPGFEEQLLDMAAGDTRVITLQFPEDYPAEDLMGKLATFDVTVNQVQKVCYPELNDAFVQEHGIFGAESVEEMRNAVAQQTQLVLEQTKKQEAEDALLNVFIDGLTGDAPRGLVEQYMQSKIETLESQLGQSGIPLEQYLEMVGSSMESLHQELFEASVRMAKLVMGIQEVAKKEQITVLPEEIEQYLSVMAEQYGMDASELRTMVNETEIKGEVLRNKVVDFLVANSEQK